MHRGVKPVLDEATIANLEAVARWLATPNRRPSLLLMGTTGNGKTTMAMAVAHWLDSYSYWFDDAERRLSFRLFTAAEIAEAAREQETARFRRMRSGEWSIIDDIGEEPADVQCWGNVVRPMVDLISYRYGRNLMTLFTTNLTGPQLEERYGKRIYDRLKEYCQVVVFRNDSYRTSPRLEL